MTATPSRQQRRSLFRRTLNALGLYTRQQVRDRARGYDAAKLDRLTSDWIASNTTGDAEIRGSNIRRIIARSRDLCRNNDYARGFLVDVESNVIGSAPFDLRMDAHEMAASGEKKPDAAANRIIEAAWTTWNKPTNCSLDGLSSWRDVKRMALRAAVQDGAVLYQHMRGARARNAHGYAIRLLEIDQLDFDNHQNLPNGATIRFGIEKDSDGRLVALHLFRNHPGDDLPAAQAGRRYVERVPASEIGILQLPDRITQTLSVPWFAAAITRLRHLGAYEEAEVVAARAGACKGGFFETVAEEGLGYPQPADGQRLNIDTEPGVWEQLPPGLKAVQHDPKHPNTAFGEFRKAMLRGIATGLGVSYVTLGNDLEAVNFSSARVGLLDEREVWKQLQLWFCEHFLEPVFREWLSMAMATGAINLPLSKFDKFNQPRFKVRRWSWVDPLKEIEAARLAVALRVTSRRQIIDEAGGDVEDVFGDNVADETLADDIGLSLTPPDVTPESIASTSTSTSVSSSTTAPAGKAGRPANPPAEPDEDDAED